MGNDGDLHQGMRTVDREESEAERRALQREIEALRAIVEGAPDGVFVVDPSGRYTDVNRAGSRMLGYTRDEIVGKAITDLMPAEDVPRFEQTWQRLVGGETVISDWNLRRKDGTFVPFEVSAAMLSDGRGRGFIREIAGRQQLEDALSAKHDDLVRAQSVAKVGSWRLDFRRKEHRWSEETHRIYGLPAVPETFDAFMACIHPDDRSRVEREWGGALGGNVYDIEHRIVADGVIKWVRSKADFEFDEHHELVGMIGITHDITDLKAHQEALRVAQERQELALRGADLAAWDWNVMTGEVVFNARWAEMRGLRPDEVVGHIDFCLSGIHPDDRPRIEKSMTDHLEGRTPEYELEFRSRTKSGDWIWIFDRGRVLARDGSGRPTRMAGTELDVTARKRAEEARKRIEDQQTLLSEMGAALASSLELGPTLESIGRLVTRKLADVCILYAIEEDGGIGRVEVTVRDPSLHWVRDVLARAPPDRSRPPAVWLELAANRSVLLSPLSPELSAASATSEEHLRAMRAIAARSAILVPLFAHGRMVGMLSLMSSNPTWLYEPTDVPFAEQIGQRAAFAISNANLYAETRRAVQTRDEVLGVVAHDLRNPLGAILVESQLLQRLTEPGNGPFKRSTEAIERAAMRMTRLVEDLLDVARLEEGGLIVAPGRLGARRAIGDAVAAQVAVARSASVELELDISGDLPNVWADRDRLLQIFENLIGNAIKFTAAGGRIRVGGASRDGEVLFWVRDTGCGISAEDFPRVFDRFWQARRDDRQRGTGLGLPIAKGLVEAHGGQIWLESALGQGTAFFFTIPTAKNDAA
jgi:PAS domain S-box-containing protein